MNRTKLKNYAPQARKDFIQAVTAKAAQYGLTAAKIEPMTEKGDVVLISGKPFPRALGDKRKRLEERIKKNGFEYSMEAMAYTWFNRLVAVRYMELHGYLDHGYRVLSNRPTTDNTDSTDNSKSVSSVTSVVQVPEILQQAQYVDLPGLDQKKVIELKLDGTKEEELYRLLLTAQFNALSKAMPFLFEKIDDETELLLPDSLLNSDSLIRKLVTEIDEEDWKEVEIIGWLYQFYISDKKDEVIGKVVKSEDIPAATQLFTPNWIVKYLVQNTIGRLWMEHHPNSPLKAKMEYYIEPAEQIPEVQKQLQDIIQQRAMHNRGLTTDNTDGTDIKATGLNLSVSSVQSVVNLFLNPEELTLLDPACGSGHILVEAYDLFKSIYEERGYRSKDIPALILQKNLFGLEIDDRAAQLAAFALMMKARADYPRIFDIEAQPNIVSFVESKGLDADEIHYALMSPLPREGEAPAERRPPDGFLFETENNLFTHAAGTKAAQTISNGSLPDITKEDIASLVALFENAKTFGSLIQVPTNLAAKLPQIEKRLDDVLAHGDLTHVSTHVLKPLLWQARLLSRQYDTVVANPPYMGSKYYTTTLKKFIIREYKEAKADLYACFMGRNQKATKPTGFHGMINIPNWMFLSSFEEMRKSLFDTQTIDTFVHNGRGIFGSDFGSCAFVIRKSHFLKYRGSYRRLFDKQGSVATNEELERRFHTAKTYTPSNADFVKITGSPIAYWASDAIRSVFERSVPLQSVAPAKHGMSTGNNNRFLRRWSEINITRINFDASTQEEARKSGIKWFPYNKGGSYRKWYGNNEFVIDYEDRGRRMREGFADGSNTGFRHDNQECYFAPGITWTTTSSVFFGVRQADRGFIFDVKGCSCFPLPETSEFVLGFMATRLVKHLLDMLNPSTENQAGNIASLPLLTEAVDELTFRQRIHAVVTECVELARIDWDAFEESWGFQSIPMLQAKTETLLHSKEISAAAFRSRFSRMKELEEENNRLFIDAYKLQNELSSEVPDEQITLYLPVREEDIKRLLSYAIGCMMGRYSLDKPGLIYAHSCNQGFDASQYKTFRADADGIIPLLEADWGIQDDAANRIVDFIGVTWPKEHLDENLKFIADSLTPTNGEQPKDTIRRYLATGFYKHHLSMYKKRPIYWLFSSGKQRAFQCLVYLHRYNEGTLARMRTEYVIPLMGKMSARMEHLQGPPEQKGAGGEIAATSAVTVKRKLEKERNNIKKQLAELQTFDERLRHYADLGIKLDLDDGVKVNYGKFSDPEYGDILAEVKAICGTKDED